MTCFQLVMNLRSIPVFQLVMNLRIIPDSSTLVSSPQVDVQTWCVKISVCIQLCRVPRIALAFFFDLRAAAATAAELNSPTENIQETSDVETASEIAL